MTDNQIDELLVDWELARQAGQELSSAQLCQNTPEILNELETKIEILKRTTWMLEDPTLRTANELASVRQSGLTKVEDGTASSTNVAGLPGIAAENIADNQGTLQFGADNRRNESSPHLLTADDRLSNPQKQALLAQLDEAGFRIVEELGRGSFGVVFRAQDKKLQRKVAIKVPFFNNPKTRSRYLQEARNAALVEATGLIPVLQVGNLRDGTPFVVQKLIDGKTLAEVLARDGFLEPHQAAAWLTEVCRAVAAAHAHSLVHRDLKPANILIDKKGHAWVADFGLAFTEKDLESRELVLSRIAGTPAYMAPEQLSDQLDRLDGRCDIWALGIILYESLTGKRPFRGATQQELREQILHHDPRPITQRRPSLNPRWNDIFRSCCAKQAADRFSSSLELATELAQLMETDTHNPVTLRSTYDSTDSITSGRSHTPVPLESRTDSGSVAAESKAATRHSIVSYAVAVSVAIAVLAVAIGSLPFLRLRPVQTQTSVERSKLKYTIAADGSGDFLSLGAALRSLSEAEHSKDTPVEIILTPGEYRESIQLDRDLIVSGSTAREDIILQGTTGPALHVPQGISLEVNGITLTDASDQSASPQNTILVKGGELLLRNCIIEAKGYDCVRVEADSIFAAEEQCVFKTWQHPAVYALQAEKIQVRHCSFEFPEASSISDTLVGIQGRQCGGIIANCHFGRKDNGPTDIEGQSFLNAAGIEWGDTTDKVVVRDCTFNGLDVGLAAFECLQLEVARLTETMEFEGCRVGIDVSDCVGEITNCQITGDATPGTIGIQLADQLRSSFILRGCTIDNVEQGLILNQAIADASLQEISSSALHAVALVQNSELTLRDSQLRKSGGFGILVEASRATLDRVDILDNSVAGIVMDGGQDALRVVGSRIQGNPAGLVVTSGSADLNNVDIANTDTGILIGRKHLLNHRVTGDSPLRVAIQGGGIDASLQAIKFLSPGTLELVECAINDAGGGRIDVLPGLTREQSGDLLRVTRGGDP